MLKASFTCNRLCTNLENGDDDACPARRDRDSRNRRRSAARVAHLDCCCSLLTRDTLCETANQQHTRSSSFNNRSRSVFRGSRGPLRVERVGTRASADDSNDSAGPAPAAAAALADASRYISYIIVVGKQKKREQGDAYASIGALFNESKVSSMRAAAPRFTSTSSIK